MTRTIRVLLADDHPLVRAGIRSTLLAEKDLTLVGEATHGDEVVQLCQKLLPDIVLLDLNMPGATATRIVADLQRSAPRVKVLILSAYDEDAYVQALLAVGVSGYVLKDEAPEAMVYALHTVAQGGVWFSRPIADKLMDWKSGLVTPAVVPTLTERELRVLRLVVEGQTNQEIGQALGISEKTVEKHLKEVFNRLGVASRVEAAVYAVRQGLV